MYAWESMKAGEQEGVERSNGKRRTKGQSDATWPLRSQLKHFPSGARAAEGGADSFTAAAVPAEAPAGPKGTVVARWYSGVRHSSSAPGWPTAVGATTPAVSNVNSLWYFTVARFDAGGTGSSDTAFTACVKTRTPTRTRTRAQEGEK